MESFFYHNNNSSNKSAKMAKQKSPSGSASITPLVVRYLSFNSSTSSSNSRSPRSIVSKYGGSSSSSGSNTGNTNPFSVVDEESVFVMDGVLVNDPNKSEEYGKSRFSTKSQSGNGKEDLRSPRFPILKNKSEICKSFITGSCAYGSKCRFIHQVLDSALVLATQMDSPIKPESTSTSTSTSTTTSISPTTFIAKDYWSPLDDGIEVTLPSHIGKPSSRENVKAYIDSVLYCPTAAPKRLPMFAEIFPHQ